MIQDISPRKFDNSFNPEAKPSAESLILVHRDGTFLLKMDEVSKTIEYPRLKDFNGEVEACYLFSVDNEEFFYADAVSDDIFPKGYEFFNMRQLRNDYLTFISHN